MTPWNKGRRKMNDRLRAAFLDHLKMTASPTRACAAAGLSTTTAYREREENLGFRARLGRGRGPGAGAAARPGVPPEHGGHDAPRGQRGQGGDRRGRRAPHGDGL